MTSPRVSILLPVRNGQGTLDGAVRSCLLQTFGDFELILVDDQSTDRTPEIIRTLADEDERVIPATTESPGGIVPALVVAARQARGEFLARMDADDWANPARFEKQVHYLDANPDIALCGCRVQIGRTDKAEGFARYEEWINNLLEPEQIATERFIESPLVHPSVMMRKGAYDAAGGYYDTAWAEDYDLWLRMLEQGMRLAKLPDPLLHWNDGRERLTRTSSRYSLERFLEAKAHYLARMDEVGRRGVSIGAAGPIGKSMARFLQARGTTVHTFIEVNPRRIGKKIHGVMVVSAEDVPEATPGAPILLAAVGQPGGRETLRELFTSRGYAEGDSFFCVC